MVARTWLECLQTVSQYPPSCLDAASGDRVLGMSLVLTGGRGGGKIKNAEFMKTYRSLGFG